MTGSVLARAIIRRGTELADMIAQVPYLLIIAQFGIMVFELFSPLVFLLSRRHRQTAIGFFYSFHLVTIATITISFAPHLAAMTSFLELERVRPVHRLRQWSAHRRIGRSVPVSPAPVGPVSPAAVGPVTSAAVGTAPPVEPGASGAPTPTGFSPTGPSPAGVGPGGVTSGEPVTAEPDTA